MIDVWVVMEEYDYETSRVRGVFTNREMAGQMIERVKAEAPTTFGSGGCGFVTAYKVPLDDLDASVSVD